LDKAAEGGKKPIEFEGPREPAQLNPHHPRFPQWINFLREQCVEGVEKTFAGVDPKTRHVAILLQPTPRTGPRLLPDGKTGKIVRVIFDASPAAFFVHSENPKFKEILSALDGSGEILVAAHPTTLEIFDVEPGRHLHKALPADELPKSFPEECRGQTALSQREIAHAFQLMREASEIPFGAIASCCSARAHEMCRLMANNGLRPCKVWNYGQGAINDETTLQVQTALVPAGYVKWLYHVAPILLGGGPGNTKAYYVLDPSLFTYPVSIDEWRRIQQDSQSTSRITGPRPYYQPFQGRTVFDDNFKRTNSVLGSSRNNLSLAG